MVTQPTGLCVGSTLSLVFLMPSTMVQVKWLGGKVGLASFQLSSPTLSKTYGG